MPEENNAVELKDEELEKEAGGTKLDRVKVEIYCKDCDNVIYSWQEIKGEASAGLRQVKLYNNCYFTNVGRREIPVQ